MSHEEISIRDQTRLIWDFWRSLDKRYIIKRHNYSQKLFIQDFVEKSRLRIRKPPYNRIYNNIRNTIDDVIRPVIDDVIGVVSRDFGPDA